MAAAKQKSSDRNLDRRLSLILFLMAGWMAAVLIALWALWLRTAPDPGLGNQQMALGWLGIGGTIGFAIWAISLGLPPGNGVRRLALVPLGLSIAVAVLVLMGWG